MNCARRNLRIVNEMAEAGGKPVIYISTMSIGFTEFTKALRKTLPHIAVMQGLDRAVGAIKALINYATLHKDMPDVVSSSSAVGARNAGKDTQECQGRSA